MPVAEQAGAAGVPMQAAQLEGAGAGCLAAPQAPSWTAARPAQAAAQSEVAVAPEVVQM
jgi:hypothetical protein